MKTAFISTLFAVVALGCLGLSSCGTTWTVSATPDGIVIEPAKGSGPIVIPVTRQK